MPHSMPLAGAPRAAGVLNALGRLANRYGSDWDRVRQDLGIAESQLRDYQARLGKPFNHDAYLSELTTLRDLLKAGHSCAPAQPGTESLLGVAELAESGRRQRAQSGDVPRTGLLLLLSGLSAQRVLA